jgi:hypothetical protein
MSDPDPAPKRKMFNHTANMDKYWKPASDKADQARQGQVINGREYLGRGCWRRVEIRERQMRDEKP